MFSIAALIAAAAQAAAATAPSASTSPATAQAAAPAASSSGDQRRYQWAPDYSSMIDMQQYPNAVWWEGEEGGGSEGAMGRPAGWYQYSQDPESGYGSYRAFGNPDDQSAMNGAPPGTNYWAIRDAGEWDLNDPNSNAWKYLQANADSFGGGRLGNVQEDPAAFYYGLREAGLLGGAARGRDQAGLDQVEASYREALEGFDPAFVDALTQAARDDLWGYWEASKQHENQPWYKDVGDVLRGFREIITLPPMAAALGSYFMTPAGAVGSTAASTALPGQGMLAGLGPVGGAAALGAGNAALQGANLEQILRAGVLGGAKSYAGGAAFGSGGEAAAPVDAGGPDIRLETPGMFGDEFGGGFFQTGGMPPAVSDPAYGLEGLARSGAVPMSSTPGGLQTDPFTGQTYSQPAMTTFSQSAGMPEVTMPTADVPLDWAGFAAGFDAPEGLDEADMQNREALEAGDDLAASEPAPTSVINPRTLTKVALALNDIFGGESGSAPQGAPQREEGQSDEQYAEQLVDYMGLDADVLAEQGLVPGSPEYYNYIMQEADAVIAQALEGVDVDSDDLAAQLRGKTEAEMQQLQRALYVRGQLEQLSGAGMHVDPFTGIEQEVVGEGMFNPDVAAFQRGLAGDVDELAGLRGQDALDFLQQRLGRKVDLYGMQQAKDEAFERAKLEDDLRRRRGMFSSY